MVLKEDVITRSISHLTFSVSKCSWQNICPYKLDKLSEVRFEFALKLIGQWKKSFLTNQSWCILKSWYTAGGPDQRFWHWHADRKLAYFGEGYSWKRLWCHFSQPKSLPLCRWGCISQWVSLTFLAYSSIGCISISIEGAFRMPPQWSCVNCRSRGICNHPSQSSWSSFITPATKWTILKITWMDSFFWCYITTWK